MYQFSLVGPSYEVDNQAVYRKLKAYLIDLPGWAWIQPHDASKDGRNNIWRGPPITMETASSANEPRLPRPSLITSITGERTKLHL
jgi:hypothetical protein